MNFPNERLPDPRSGRELFLTPTVVSVEIMSVVRSSKTWGSEGVKGHGYQSGSGPRRPLRLQVVIIVYNIIQSQSQNLFRRLRGG